MFQKDVVIRELDALKMERDALVVERGQFIAEIGTLKLQGSKRKDRYCPAKMFVY